MARFDKLRWVEYLWLLLGIFKKAFDLCNSWVRQGMCKKLSSWDFCFVFTKMTYFFVNGSDKHVLLLPILWWVNVFKKMFKKCLNVVVFTHPMGCYTYEIWNVNVTSSPVCVHCNAVGSLLTILGFLPDKKFFSEKQYKICHIFEFDDS